MKQSRVFAGAVAIVTLFLVACGPDADIPRNPEATLPVEQIVLAGPTESVRVQAEIADDEQEWGVGLMNRYLLPDGTGMLFVFPNEIERSFWMKNTLIPLDIVFFDAQEKFVSATTMQPCKKDPCQRYSSHGIAQTALELPAGFVDSHAIGEQWTLYR